jgi:hypothetical protein
LVDDGVPAGKQDFADIKLGAERVMSETMAQKAVEEETRPPYLHVITHLGVEDTVLTPTVYDCWRDRWDYWGPFDAFSGYGQDSPAGRSAYSSEVYDHGIFILYDITARRHTERLVWRLASGFAWIIPWDHHFLWHVRVQQKTYDRLWHHPAGCLSYKWYVKHEQK